MLNITRSFSLTTLFVCVSLVSGCSEKSEEKSVNMNTDTIMPTYLYKVVNQKQWLDIQEKGLSYHQGSELDKRDGYLHMSTSTQVKRIANKYFSDLDNGKLIQIDYSKIKNDIKWEANSKGEDFPHAYDVIAHDSIVKTYDFATQSFNYSSLVY